MCALQSALPIQRGFTTLSRQDLLVSATDRVPKKIKLPRAEFRRPSLRSQHVGIKVAVFGGNQPINGLKAWSAERLLVRASSETPSQPSDNQSQNSPFRSRDGEESQNGRDVGGLAENGVAFNRQDGSDMELLDRAKKGGRDVTPGTTFKEIKRIPEQSGIISENGISRDNERIKDAAGQDPLQADGSPFYARASESGNGLVGSRDGALEVQDSDFLEEGTRCQDASGKQEIGVEGKGTEYTTVEDDMKMNAAIAGAAGLVWEKLRNNPVVHFLAQWPAWQQKKRLERLQTIADANPKDANKQAALLAELYKSSPQAVIDRFERREHATDGQTVVEYLRALVATNAIVEYLPDERTGRLSGLPALLQELKQRASGDSEEAFAPPGMTEQQPLHVVMVEPKSASKSMRFMQELVSTILFMIVFSIIWVMGAAALRKYVNGIAGMGSSSSMSPSNVYAPKEFNKEAVPEKNVKTFKDVKGCDEAKAELEEIVEYLKNPAKFTRLGGKLPKGVLLIGPPGTGKTLLAKAIAGEAGVPFYYRAGSEFEEMFVGVGARRVRSLFQAAKKKAPCIVFIDEIDAVGGSRKQWEGHTKKTLNQLLVEMDGFEANEGIIVLAATNLPETLDPALTRPGRFDRHVVVTNPDVRGRQEILELYLQDKPLSENVDINILARGTPGFSGADLANLVNMAAVKAAVDGNDKICTDQLEFAKDKILMGTERKSLSLSEESRKLTAYHESGHAVVAFNTAGANPIHKATITPRGTALGMVTQLPDKDETSVSKKQMLARLDVCMGGRVAEEMIFGAEQVTSGARSDLQQATALARHMVSECGMSDTVGPIFIDTESQRQSHDIQKSIDAEVVRLLKEAYERVKKLLKKHEADLHALARALLETETLNSQEIKAILSPFHPLEQVEEEAISATADI